MARDVLAEIMAQIRAGPPRLVTISKAEAVELEKIWQAGPPPEVALAVVRIKVLDQ